MTLGANCRRRLAHLASATSAPCSGTNTFSPNEAEATPARHVLSAAEINKKAAVNQMNQMLEKANQAQSVGLIRAGMGKGVPVGVISHLLVQVKGELEEAVRQAREAGVSEEAIRPALEGLEAIKATQSDES